MGSCVDNTRILTVLTQMATEGGLGDDISDIPAVGIAPEWMSEKALAIATYCAASGAYVIMGVRNPVEGSDGGDRHPEQGLGGPGRRQARVRRRARGDGAPDPGAHRQEARRAQAAGLRSDALRPQRRRTHARAGTAQPGGACRGPVRHAGRATEERNHVTLHRNPRHPRRQRRRPRSRADARTRRWPRRAPRRRSPSPTRPTTCR